MRRKESLRRLRRFRLCARLLQQARKPAQFLCREVMQLPAMEFLYGRIQLSQNPEPFRRDARPYDAPVLLSPRAQNQSPRFHPVQQARDVRVARDHPAADLAAGEAFGPRAAQNAKHIVLRCGEAGRLEQRLGSPGQGIGRAEQADEDLGFQARFRRPGLCWDFALLGHAGIIVVITTIVKRRFLSAGFSATSLVNLIACKTRKA